MNNRHIVLTTADYDCDGVSYGHHRISVPASRYLKYLNGCESMLLRHAVQSEQLSSCYDCATMISTLPAFMARLPLGSFEREYFIEAGYCSDSSGLRDCTAPYETTGDLAEAHWISGIETDMALL